MKKIFLILFIIITLANTQTVMAISPTSSPTDIPEPTQSRIDTKIDLLKNKVASKVAELNLVEKKGFIGVVEKNDNNLITLTDLNNNTRIVEVDELTKFNSDTNDDFDIANVKKGSKIAVAGLYNKESRKLLARYVNEINIPVFLQGVISEKNKEDYTVKLTTEDGKTYLVDIENITKTFEFSDGDLSSAGFLDINDMQNALVVGFPDKKENDRITATKIVIFPDIPKNPKIKVSETTTETPTPTPTEK